MPLAITLPTEFEQKWRGLDAETRRRVLQVLADLPFAHFTPADMASPTKQAEYFQQRGARMLVDSLILLNQPVGEKR